MDITKLLIPPTTNPNEITIKLPSPPSSPYTPETWFTSIPRTVTDLHIDVRYHDIDDSTFDYPAAFTSLLGAVPSHFPALKHIELYLWYNLTAYFDDGDDATELMDGFYDKGVAVHCVKRDDWRAYRNEQAMEEMYENGEFGDGDEEEAQWISEIWIKVNVKLRKLDTRKGLSEDARRAEYARIWKEGEDEIKRGKEEFSKEIHERYQLSDLI
jgi:hypothetical protein